MAVSMETTTEVLYTCDLTGIVLCEETGKVYFNDKPSATHSAEQIRELAKLLDDIAIKMESLYV